MPYEDDKDREKPNWREIDANKDRKQYFQDKNSTSKSRSAQYQDKRADSQAKAALNDFFQGKKSKAAGAEWKKVRAARGSELSKLATTYVDKNGMPREWDDLLFLLDHDEANFVDQVLDKLSLLAPKETPVRLELLVGKLRVLKMMREEPPLIAKIEKLEADASTNL